MLKLNKRTYVSSYSFLSLNQPHFDELLKFIMKLYNCIVQTYSYYLRESKPRIPTRVSVITTHDPYVTSWILLS